MEIGNCTSFLIVSISRMRFTCIHMEIDKVSGEFCMANHLNNNYNNNNNLLSEMLAHPA